MININKYIGIPYLNHGRTFEGADCYGLVRLFLQNEFNTLLPDFWGYESAMDGEIIQSLVEKNTPILADEITKKEISVGDIVLYRYKNTIRHMGVYVGNGMVLHTTIDISSVCVPFDAGSLKGRVHGIYRIKTVG